MPEKQKCVVCGYTEISELPPSRCPVCKAESDRFIAHKYVPEHIDIMPDRRQVHVIDAMDISSFENENAESSLTIKNLILEPDQKIEDFKPEKDCVIVVLEGKAEITTAKFFFSDVLNEDTSAETLVVESNSETEDNSEDLKESNVIPVSDKDNELELNETAEKKLTSDHTFVLKHQAILLPSMTGLSIKNAGDNTLTLLIIS